MTKASQATFNITVVTPLTAALVQQEILSLQAKYCIASSEPVIAVLFDNNTAVKTCTEYRCWPSILFNGPLYKVRRAKDIANLITAYKMLHAYIIIFSYNSVTWLGCTFTALTNYHYCIFDYSASSDVFCLTLFHCGNVLRLVLHEHFKGPTTVLLTSILFLSYYFTMYSARSFSHFYL